MHESFQIKEELLVMLNKEKIVIDVTKKYGDSLQIDNLLDLPRNLSFAELEEVIGSLLKSQDRNKINETCFLIRDLIVCGHRYAELSEFRDKYPKSKIVEDIENLLYSLARDTVRDAIYTLGKTCSYSSLVALEKAFYYWRDTDPLILSRLFCEMQWLGLENFWELIDSIISSDVYFTRWAAIDLLPIEIEPNDKNPSTSLQQTYNCLEKLKQDSHEVIRIEAEYKQRWIDFKLIASTLPKSDRRKQRKQLKKQYKSILSFDSLSQSFRHYLNLKQMSNYTISQLDIFFDYFIFFNRIHKSSS